MNDREAIERMLEMANDLSFQAETFQLENKNLEGLLKLVCRSVNGTIVLLKYALRKANENSAS